MKQSDIFRENADNCLQLAERAEGSPAFKRYERMARAWTALAHEQDWLDGEVSPLPVQERRERPEGFKTSLKAGFKTDGSLSN
jgi:hypothetical protein